jgi:hypothetical protein
MRLTDKSEIIQHFVDKVGGPDYLEIGVDKGENLSKIVSAKKTGVDPRPSGNIDGVIECTSDEYFSSNPRVDGVIFIDGMHTYQQSLRDVENSLRCMSDRTVILMHDTNPTSEEEASPDPRAYGDSWMGDVWKTVAHIRSLMRDMTVYTIDIPAGLTVITKSGSDCNLDFKQDEIKGMPFTDFKSKSRKILNMKRWTE